MVLSWSRMGLSCQVVVHCSCHFPGHHPGSSSSFLISDHLASLWSLRIAGPSPKLLASPGHSCSKLSKDSFELCEQSPTLELFSRNFHLRVYLHPCLLLDVPCAQAPLCHFSFPNRPSVIDRFLVLLCLEYPLWELA